MDLPDQDRLASPATPEPTRLALLATLGIVAVSVATFLSGPADAGRAGAYLALYTVLFSLRVAGQIAVAAAQPAWLPPMHEWNFVPYRILLPIQLALLALMSVVVVDLFGGGGVFSEQSDPAGAVVIGLSYAYWAAMAVRYARRMVRRPEERWFGGTIPIVFHCVLAAFLFVYGSYLAGS
jgi:hypothetical protein